MATLAQLESQIEKLQRRAQALREKESAEVIARIVRMMDECGLTTADLLKAGLASGRKRGRPAGSTNARSVHVKAGGASKLPPKYRDPVSGATWSGHARPPAWIKDAPDRSVYLIDGAAKQDTRRKRAASASRAAGAKRAARGTAKKAARRSAHVSTGKTSRKSAESASA
ncbi:DNA-binding protein [Caballeronia hypogeia]|uniref:DNA-binding protein n=1 Tax=Caballeronia hypogeia TaxID=1777140 RepID=A0A157ZFT6_9BURK|nr:H-NS histone family protein [Caballeronia hypogeia]SAK44401.1 DNA-binding protein [Caballeronia hypogeia]